MEESDKVDGGPSFPTPMTAGRAAALPVLTTPVASVVPQDKAVETFATDYAELITAQPAIIEEQVNRVQAISQATQSRLSELSYLVDGVRSAREDTAASVMPQLLSQAEQ